jgi:hypothetical protein
MVNCALLKNFSFDLKQNKKFKNINYFDKQLCFKIIEEYINENIEFVSIDKTLDFYQLSNLIFNGKTIDITNCYYDDKILIQGLSVDDLDTYIFIKRKIHNNDTYTFLEYRYDENNPDNSIDPYEYETITINDIINIIYKKYVINGIYIDADSSIKPQKMSFIINRKYESNDIMTPGVIDIEMCDKIKEIKYLDISKIINKFMSDNVPEQEYETKINQITSAINPDYFYSRFDIGFGIINYCIKVNQSKKNELMSAIIKEDIVGDVYLWYECSANKEEVIINLSLDLFNCLSDTIINKIKRTIKNPSFFNIYRELTI